MCALPAKHQLTVVDDEDARHEQSAKYDPIVVKECFVGVENKAVQYKEKAHRKYGFRSFISKNKFEFVSCKVTDASEAAKKRNVAPRFLY